MSAFKRSRQVTLAVSCIFYYHFALFIKFGAVVNAFLARIFYLSRYLNCWLNKLYTEKRWPILILKVSSASLHYILEYSWLIDV